MKLSHLAWKQSLSITERIVRHPFVLELIEGSLCWSRFSFYLEQDKLYLEDYARCLAVIADKAPTHYQAHFSRYANHAVISEQDRVYGHYNQNHQIKRSGAIAPATLRYSGALLRTCLNEPLEIAVASILPCFWIYQHIGYLAKIKSNDNNLYQPWIDTYSSSSFSQGTEAIIGLFNDTANRSSKATQEKMVKTYKDSSAHEWNFFDDCYHLRRFDGSISALSTHSQESLKRF
jgi:thiaminase/transcriptional activator TenA